MVALRGKPKKGFLAPETSGRGTGPPPGLLPASPVRTWVVGPAKPSLGHELSFLREAATIQACQLTSP